MHNCTLAQALYYTHYNLNSTDIARSWSVRKSNSLVEIKTIKQIHNCIPCPDVSVSNVDFDNFRETLVNLSVPVGFSWLLQLETESITSEHLLVDSTESLVLDKRCQYLVNSKDFVTLTNYVKAKMYVTDLSIIQVAKNTVGQINNDLWYKYRKNRLTASHFGQVLATSKKGKFSKSLFKSLNNDTNLSGIHSIQWGISNENSAIDVLR